MRWIFFCAGRRADPSGAHRDDRPRLRAVPDAAVRTARGEPLVAVLRAPGESAENLALMRRLDELHLAHPFYGSRQMTRHLRREGVVVGRHRVRRLMRLMGMEAVYRRPRTSVANPEHRVYPYLLRDLAIDRPDQVWCADITYIPVSQGFFHLAAVMDWASRHVLSWRLSNTMDSAFCVDALDAALRFGVPEIFNTDQGARRLRTVGRSPAPRSPTGCAPAARAVPWTGEAAIPTTSSSSALALAAAVALAEVRGGVPARVGGRPRRRARRRIVVPLLRRVAPPFVAGRPDVNINVAAKDEQWKNTAMYNLAQKYGNVKTALATDYIISVLASKAGAGIDAEAELTTTLQSMFAELIPG